jgi:VanZ family protein
MTGAAWACLAFIAYATLSPPDARPELIANGYLKALFTVLERFGAYVVLGCLFGLVYPRNLTFVCVLVFGSAVVLELLQNLVPGRDARLLDAAEKLIGGAAGILIRDIIQSGFWPQMNRER